MNDHTRADQPTEAVWLEVSLLVAQGNRTLRQLQAPLIHILPFLLTTQTSQSTLTTAGIRPTHHPHLPLKRPPQRR